MIRVTITLIPAGVDDFAKEITSLDIGCSFPLDPANQNFHIFQGMNYAELLGFDSRNQPDDESGWWNLVLEALIQLKTNGVRRVGGEIFPGMLAVEPEAFDKILELLIENYGASIKSIHLFGKRTETPEMFTTVAFMKDIVKLSKSGGRITGGFLFEHWPGYQPYYLAIKLKPELYRTGKVKNGSEEAPNQGIMLEKLINIFSYGKAPREKDLFINNGLCIFYFRPGPDKEIISYSFDKDFRNLNNIINRGNLIYDLKDKLYKYPGLRVAHG